MALCRWILEVTARLAAADCPMAGSRPSAACTVHQRLCARRRRLRGGGAAGLQGCRRRSSLSKRTTRSLPSRCPDNGPLAAVIAESMVGGRQTEVAAVFERTEHYRPTEPHWYLSLIGVDALHRNKGCGAALLQHRLWSSNPLNTSPYQRHGFEIASTIRVHRLQSPRCCVMRADPMKEVPRRCA